MTTAQLTCNRVSIGKHYSVVTNNLISSVMSTAQFTCNRVSMGAQGTFASIKQVRPNLLSAEAGTGNFHSLCMGNIITHR